LLPGDKLDIKEGPQGLFIPGLRVEAVGGAEDVVAVLQKGKQHRSTFATNMNEHSSRSHLVLTIYVKGYDTAKGEQTAARAIAAQRQSPFSHLQVNIMSQQQRALHIGQAVNEQMLQRFASSRAVSSFCSSAASSTSSSTLRGQELTYLPLLLLACRHILVIQDAPD
jgi:hypothetical protein